MPVLIYRTHGAQRLRDIRGAAITGYFTRGLAVDEENITPYYKA